MRYYKRTQEGRVVTITKAFWYLSFSFAASLLAVLLFSPSAAYAAASPEATQACQSNATGPTTTVITDACADGYDNGDGTGQVCGKYADAQQNQSCRDGYVKKLEAERLRQSVVSDKCNVQGLGWIVCWVSKFIGSLVDGLFIVLEKLLTVPSLDPNQDGGKELYKIWGMFRTIANVVFVIILLAVIISQVTNQGINNYGVKRIIPRIVVGVVLINASFIICGLIVDLSNIAGVAIKDVLTSVAIPVKPDFSTWSTIISLGLVGAAGVSVYLSVFSIAPVIVAGLVALLMTVAILVVRQALLIALVIIAPVAFALNILPSTQKWFSRWWSSFIILAMVFPAIAFIFGATQVAAGVISASAPPGAFMTILFGSFALGVQSIPFFVTPLLMKVGGGLLNRFTGIVNDPSKGLIDRGRRRVDQWSANKTKVRETNALTGDGKGLYTRITRRKNLTSKVAESHKKDLSSHTSGAFGNFVGTEENRRKLAQSAARTAGSNILDQQGASDRAALIEDSLKKTSLQLDIDDVDAADAILVDRGYDSDDLKKAIETGKHKDGSNVTEDEKAAAIKRLASQGNLDDIHRLVNDMSHTQSSAKALHALADGIDASGVSKTAAHLGPAATSAMRSTPVGTSGFAPSVDSLYTTAANRGVYSADTLSNQSTKALTGLANIAPLLNTDVRASLQNSRDTLNSRDKLRARQASSGHAQLKRF